MKIHREDFDLEAVKKQIEAAIVDGDSAHAADWVAVWRLRLLEAFGRAQKNHWLLTSGKVVADRQKLSAGLTRAQVEIRVLLDMAHQARARRGLRSGQKGAQT